MIFFGKPVATSPDRSELLHELQQQVIDLLRLFLLHPVAGTVN
jgi:hypothetical protein